MTIRGNFKNFIKPEELTGPKEGTELRYTKITVILGSKPERSDINQELQWFAGSLGLFGLRDKDKSCFRIFITLLKSLKAGERLSSDEIAARTGLTRGTIVHHLNNLMDSGIVRMDRNKYFLRMDSLEEMVDYLKRDADEAWDRIRGVAKNIDEKLGL
ncbi:winged helix-turn-helix transcriptional regulator [Candidatus Woesearchaeota archaeon]|nr:winged helix-turn-helix transcriptional regulator [Candidatus Woesearchaeota archaeon]